MRLLKETAIATLLVLAICVDVPADQQLSMPHNLSGISLDRPSTVTLSEMEKANNALARVMGRIPPHVPQIETLIMDSRHWSQGVEVKNRYHY